MSRPPLPPFTLETAVAVGVKHTRIASVDDLPITQAEGRRPVDPAGLSELGL